VIPRHACLASCTGRASTQGPSSAPLPTSMVPHLVWLQKHAEAFFPCLDAQAGLPLQVYDIWGGRHTVQLRFWQNQTTSRIYVLEARSVLDAYRLEVGASVDHQAA
jgi:hypothetical protein